MAAFALETYGDISCKPFTIKYNTDYNTKDLSLDTKMHKAITIIQFKLEGQLILRHPEFVMEERMLLHRINYDTKSVTVDGWEYPMLDTDFPTVNPGKPYELTEGETEVMVRLQQAFQKCEKLQRHVKFLFSKGGMYKKMATFERYFIADSQIHEERKNSYYRLLEQEEVVTHILEEFGLNARDAHIVNGHVPVEQIHGESPIKCGGRLLIIDGGFSRAYQKKTGIAGYTLVSNSRGMRLVAHEPFESARAAILNETDIFSDSVVVENFYARRLVADTDIGREIKENIYYLEELLEAYRDGTIMEA